MQLFEKIKAKTHIYKHLFRFERTLSSEQAIAVNIQIVRLFTYMRKSLMDNKDIMLKMEEIEKKFLQHDRKIKSFELEIQLIFQALKKLLDPAKPEREKIGFKNKKDEMGE